MSSENAQSVQILDELMQKLTISQDAAATKEAAAALASFMNGRIEDKDVPEKYVQSTENFLVSIPRHPGVQGSLSSRC
jgi:elongation factor 3